MERSVNLWIIWLEKDVSKATFLSKHIQIQFQFSSVQLLSRVQLFVTPWITARQASLSITNSWSSLRLTSIESVIPSNHLILCRPLLLLLPIPPSIRVFSNESTLRMRWSKYWSFSISIIPSKEIPGLISLAYNFFSNSAFFFYFILFNFTILYWFFHISKWICHRHTCLPHPEPSSLPIPSLWVIPVHQPQASSIMHRTWTGNSFHIWYYTYFNAILPNHPTLSLSHRVQKTSLYICVSFALSHTGL